MNIYSRTHAYTRIKKILVILSVLLTCLSAWAKINFNAALVTGVPASWGQVYAAYTAAGAPAPLPADYTASSASVPVNDTYSYLGYYLAVPAEGYRFVGWYANAQATIPAAGTYTDNPYVYTQTNAFRTITRNYYAKFELLPRATITFDPTTNGSYTACISGQTENLVGQTLTNVFATFDLHASPAPGYKVMAWYHEADGVRQYFDHADELLFQKFASGHVGIVFTQEENPVWVVRDTLLHKDHYSMDLHVAIDSALAIRDRGAWNERTTIALASSGTLPVGDYTIPSRVYLYIPFSSNYTPLDGKPNATLMQSDWDWSTYSTTEYCRLSLTDGCNLDVYGYISIGGTQAMTAAGNPSGYPVGPCGRLDMSEGGSITLYDGGRIFCWGFITGQTVVDGNNTRTVGTIHALSGSAVYEYFIVGDWRGGGATATIVDQRFDWRVFPFTNYYIQNVEVPISFEYGSAEYCSTAVQAASMSMGLSTVFCLIGSTDAMFQLTDAQSLVRTWYDPTTDHMVYELSGSADISLLKVNFYVDVNSQDYNLPIPSSMHVKLRDCHISVTNPMTIQAGAVFEVMPQASLTIDTCLYIFDHDDWGKFVNGYYYRTLNRTMTPHFDRGEGDVNNLEDARIIVDGSLTVGSHGHLYCTNGGANICGRGGGQFAVTAHVPDSASVVQLLGSQTPTFVPVYAAKLCSENGTYLPTEDFTQCLNVAGRWFRTADATPQQDHTYRYTYIRTDASGHFVKADASHFVMDTTAAVLWYDANGLSHWTDVRRPVGTACYEQNPDTWLGTDGCYYFYSGAEWIRLVPVEGTSVFGGSDNHLYTCAGTTWIEGEGVDDDCLYTIDGVKSALVGKSFVPMTKNAPYDYAWHRTTNAGEYYLCFSGCDWRRAERVPGYELAYYVYPTLADFEQGHYETYIWIADSADWVQVEYEDPYFYTITDENLRLYWDYYPAAPGQTWGTWEVAQPIVRVDYGYTGQYREFFNLPDAVLFASTKSRSSITLSRDLTTDKAMRYSPNVVGSTCTLDLNGHIVTSSTNRALTIDYTYCTFRIVDSSSSHAGKFLLMTSDAKTSYALYVATGTLVLDSVAVTAYSSAGTTYALYTNTDQHTTMDFGYLSAYSINRYTAPIAGPAGTTQLTGGYLTSNTNVSRYLPECYTTRKLTTPLSHAGTLYSYEVVRATYSLTVVTDNPALGSVDAVLVEP